LLFNAEQFDVALNSTAASYTDRLGVVRRTVKGQFDAVDAELAAKLDDAQSQINVKVDEATASAADAADSALEALGYLQVYRTTSYGPYASDPATDPLGNPPTVGDEYFSTTSNLLKRFNGTTWQASDINTANLAAQSGSSLVGYQPAGTGAVTTTTQEKLREIRSSKDVDASSDGVTNDGLKIRSLFADAPVGSVLLIKAGTYLLDQDGVNPWCLNISKRLHLIFEPGVTFKAATAGVRSVIRISAAITHEGAPTIDGDYKTNHAVECVIGAKGTTLKKWRGGKVTQQYNAGFSACPFSTVSEIGVIFDDCEAHDAIGYPNSVTGDAAGTASGFYFYGTAPSFGVNAVVNSRVDNIRNTNGLNGAYEDEDAIITQMAGSFTLVDNNTITNCMKRGVKMINRGLVNANRVISTKTEADGAAASNRMYSGISIYADDVTATNNEIGSGTAFGLVSGGTFSYGIEVGVSGQKFKNVTCSGNKVTVGASSNATSVELARFWGALTNFNYTGNRHSVDDSLTIGFTTWGIRADFDHATERATVDINSNVLSNSTYSMQLRGGFSGRVNGNEVKKFKGGLGAIVVDSSSSALRPLNVEFSANKGFGVNDYTVRINDTLAVGITAAGNTTESTTTAAVFIAAGIRANESGSFGGPGRAAQVVVAAPPTTGTWSRGDIALNNDPRDASPVVEWRCQYGGTPGTWRAASWLVTRGATVSRPTLTANDAGVQHLDTTLAAAGKPITWTGTVWVDATGAAV
jgi:hypothetical protein